MNSLYTFALDFGHTVSERSAICASEKEARHVVWSGLTDSERDGVASVELVAVDGVKEPPPLFDWSHVEESGRPRDTGERTWHGHRLIGRPGFYEISIEFPFNSGTLISTAIYEKALDGRMRDHSEVLLAAARQALMALRRCSVDCPGRDTVGALEDAIKDALGVDHVR